METAPQMMRRSLAPPKRLIRSAGLSNTISESRLELIALATSYKVRNNSRPIASCSFPPSRRLPRALGSNHIQIRQRTSLRI